MSLIVRFAPFAAARAWLAKGFPHYVLEDAQKDEELRSLLKYDHSGLIRRGVVGQTMHGLRLAWSYFPHAWAVRVGNSRTPLELFSHQTLMTKALEKRGKLHSRGKRVRYEDSISPDIFTAFLPISNLTAASVRKALRTYSGTQGVSNFRPTAAAAIYDKLLPEQGGVTWDMSCGWGGRLLGATASKKVHKYIGCDPATETFEGLERLRDDIYRLVPERGKDWIKLHMVGSEMMRPKLKPNSVDLCFTSPPYFAQEKYSDEPTQSWKKFRTQEKWLTEFMGATLENCAYCLKPDGILAVNIADVRGYPELARDFVALAKSKAWRLEKTLRLALSAMLGAKHKHDKFKYEPIFVFRRE